MPAGSLGSPSRPSRARLRLELINRSQLCTAPAVQGGIRRMSCKPLSVPCSRPPSSSAKVLHLPLVYLAISGGYDLPTNPQRCFHRGASRRALRHDKCKSSFERLMCSCRCNPHFRESCGDLLTGAVVAAERSRRSPGPPVSDSSLLDALSLAARSHHNCQVLLEAGLSEQLGRLLKVSLPLHSLN